MLKCTLKAELRVVAQAGPDMNAGQNAGQDSSKHGDNVQDADFEEVK